MATLASPIRRIRQACETCRRKKARCPGEKPTCSRCTRLGQRCIYLPEGVRISTQPLESTPHRQVQASDDDEHSLNGPGASDRLSNLEARLADMQSLLGRQPWANPRDVLFSPQTQSPAASTLTSRGESQSASTQLPPWDLVFSVTEHYLQFCDNQPLPLLSTLDWSARLSRREPELLFAMMALCVRFSEGTLNQPQMAERYARSAESLIMRRLPAGPIELSTIQSLCLLSLYEFNNKNSHRASLYISLALNFVNSSRLSPESRSSNLGDIAREERCRCYWSVFMLNNLHGNDASMFTMDHHMSGLPYPTSQERLSRVSSRLTDSGLDRSELFDNSLEPNDLGIIAYTIQLSTIWRRAVTYARHRSKAESHPQWSLKSEYSQINSALMDIETKMPYKHRFRPLKFEDVSAAELRENRGYWAPWIFFQMLYHAILCLLNHPLLFSLRLRSFRVTNIPEVYLQQTVDLISTNTGWFAHLILLIAEKQFQVSDPFLAYCACVVATIFLQQSYGSDYETHRAKQAGFQRCMEFIRPLATKWPKIAELEQKLRAFEDLVSRAYEATDTSSSDNPSVHINLSLFWEILESSLISDKEDDAGSMFGTSLQSRPPDPDAAEIINTQLLPEPTRVSRDQQLTASTDHVLRRGASPSSNTLGPPPTNGIDDLNVLAQSYFAQGQDFVHGIEDWWSLP